MSQLCWISVLPIVVDYTVRISELFSVGRGMLFIQINIYYSVIGNYKSREDLMRNIFNTY